MSSFKISISSFKISISSFNTSNLSQDFSDFLRFSHFLFPSPVPLFSVSAVSDEKVLVRKLSGALVAELLMEKMQLVVALKELMGWGDPQ